MTTNTIAPTKPLTKRQLEHLLYLDRLNDEFDARDYAVYGDDASLVRNADIAFLSKVGHAFATNSRIWA